MADFQRLMGHTIGIWYRSIGHCNTVRFTDKKNASIGNAYCSIVLAFMKITTKIIETISFLLSIGSILLASAAFAGLATDAKSTPSAPPVEKKKETKETPIFSFWDGRLVFDIEERMRLEIRDHNRTFSGVHDISDGAWLLNRFRLGLAFTPVPWVKLYGQTQDAREAFSDRPNIPGVNSAEGDDEWDLRQAYVALRSEEHTSELQSR